MTPMWLASLGMAWLSTLAEQVRGHAADTPIQRLPVGQSPSEFLEQFKATVLQGTGAPEPADFRRLAGAPAVTTARSYGRNVSAAGVPAFLGDTLPADVLAKLKEAIPALMLAHGGQMGTMVYQSFNVGHFGGGLELAFAGARCGDAAASACDLAFVAGTAAAEVLQQYATYYEDCCDCDFGDCDDWFSFGCDGCDRTTPRADTPEEVERIEQGLQAAVHSSFAASFPAHLPAAASAPPPPPAAAPLGDGWDLLKDELQKFLNRFDTQQFISRQSSSAVVQQVQSALKEISDEVSVLKVPQVALSDVEAVVKIGLGGVHMPPELVDGLVRWVLATAKEARNATSATAQWMEREVIQSDGVTTEYFTVHMYYDPASSPYVDLVTCAYQNTMHLENLTITTTSSYGPDGKLDVNITTASSPISGEDLEQFEILWKYAVDDAVLKALEGAPAGHVTPRMRVLPFRLRGQLSRGGLDGAFDAFQSILSECSGLWQGIVSAFGSHTSQKIQIVSKGGFTKFNEATDTYMVPGVRTADFDPFLDAVMSEYDEKTRQETKVHLKALLFSHSTNDTSTWLRQHIVWGKNQSAGGCGVDHGCAEFFVAHVNPHLSQDSNHFALCAYKTDFVLAPTIELITTSESYLGGLFSDEEDEIRELPPVFTPEDETHLRQFMGVQCQYMSAMALGMKLPAPVWPSSGAAAAVALAV